MKAQNNMNVVAVYKNVNNFTSYMFIIGFFAVCDIRVANTQENEKKGRINGILHDKARIVYDSYHEMVESTKKHTHKQTGGERKKPKQQKKISD